MARERGLGVDTAGFEVAMQEQKARSRGARVTEVITAKTATAAEADPYADAVQTEFVGYVRDTCIASVEEIREDGGNVYAVVNRSPFYAEMGGQVGDIGIIQISGKPDVTVANTVRRGPSYFLRLADPADKASLSTDRLVSLEIDATRRRAIETHHTATHLLHWASARRPRKRVPTSARTGCGSTSTARP